MKFRGNRRFWLALPFLVVLAGAAFLIGLTDGHGGASATPAGTPSDASSGTTPPSYEPAGSEPAVEQTKKTSSVVIREAELVGPGEGWSLTSAGLEWTTDAGNSWRSITPAGLEPGEIISTYFTDAEHGWLTASPDPSGAAPTLEVFSTVDGGHQWERSLISDPELLSISNVHLFFRGSHGWVVVAEEGMSNQTAHLYATTDGGRDWQVLPRPPLSGSIGFASETVGWLEGGVGGQTLWRTGDAGETWSKVVLPSPGGAEASSASYILPQITPGGTGLLPVTYQASADEGAIVAVYTSSDGGASWHLGPTTPLNGGVGIGASASITGYVGDGSVAIRDPAASGLAVLTLSTVNGPVGQADSAPTSLLSKTLSARGLPVAAPLKFVNARDGIAVTDNETCSGGKECVVENQLLFSTDGGSTWSDSPTRP